MRRALPLLLSVFIAVDAVAQGYLPLSRTVELPYAAGLHAYRAQYHTAIRPYFDEEARAALGSDTLPRSAIRLLDRWAMDSLPWKFRGGPLLDAEVGFPLDEEQSTIHRASGGFWCDWSPHRTLLVHADAQV
jgi:hypothetical protein